MTYMIGDIAAGGFDFGFSEGIISFFYFLCMLSVILFLMNLLPIPVLDGGQILVFLVELIRRKPLNPKFLLRFQVVGFLIIISLLVFAVFSDVLYFMGS